MAESIIDLLFYSNDIGRVQSLLEEFPTRYHEDYHYRHIICHAIRTSNDKLLHWFYDYLQRHFPQKAITSIFPDNYEYGDSRKINFSVLLQRGKWKVVKTLVDLYHFTINDLSPDIELYEYLVLDPKCIQYVFETANKQQIPYRYRIFCCSFTNTRQLHSFDKESFAHRLDSLFNSVWWRSNYVLLKDYHFVSEYEEMMKFLHNLEQMKQRTSKIVAHYLPSDLVTYELLLYL